MKKSYQSPELKDFNSFLIYCKNEIINISLDDIKNGNYLLYDIFHIKKNKLETAVFQSDIDEVKAFAKKSTKEFHRYLNNEFTSGSYRGKYTGGIPQYLIDARMFVEYLNLYNEAEQKVLKPKTPQKKAVTVELKDFFNGVDQDTINAIQDEFKDFNGKRLAMLLHRLVDMELVSYLPNSKTKARKHFVKLFKDEDYNLSYTNRILSDENELTEHSINDPDYIDIKEKLSKALKKEVV